jgi:hypothetical protein
MKPLNELLVESDCKPLSIDEYLETFQVSIESLGYEIENNLVLACFNWKSLRINHEYEIRWHLESVADVLTGFIDGEKVQGQSYNLSKQPYSDSCTQSDSSYANLIRLEPVHVNKLLLKEIHFITVMDGMTFYPFCEYFTISHRLKQNKWFEAHITSENLKFINLITVEPQTSIPINYLSSPLERHKFNVMTCLEDLMNQGLFNDLQAIPLGIKAKVISLLSDELKKSARFSGKESVRRAWRELSKAGEIALKNKASYSKN